MKHLVYRDTFSKAAEGYAFYKDAAQAISVKLRNHAYEMDGFMDYPLKADACFLAEIQAAADEIKHKNEILVVLGVGGSYLGAKAMIEMLGNPSPTKVLFGGCNLSSDYHKKLLAQTEGRNFSVLVISKSGKTLETLLAFSLFKDELKKRYPESYAARIYAVTDSEEGDLRAECRKEGYRSFALPRDIGGRYSVLTVVGLLPAAVAGLDIKAIMKGAADAYGDFESDDIFCNDCLKYAALRRILNGNFSKDNEIFVFFEPRMMFFGEWLKQLFGESEGKGGRGLFPVSFLMSTDLHSLGQYLQDGKNTFFETMIYTKSAQDLAAEMPLSMNEYNEIVYKSALNAHTGRGTPVVCFEIASVDAASFGYIVYYFEKACAVSGLLLGINPFDQPGVEIYKAEMQKFIKSMQ